MHGWHKSEYKLMAQAVIERAEDSKSKRSRRTVTIPASTVEALRERRKAMRNRLEQWSDDDLIFATESGDLPDYRGLVRHHFNPFLKKAGLRKLTPKAMRHGHLSGLLATRMSSLTVATRAGHSGTKMLDEAYGHVTQAEDEEAAEVSAQRRRANIKLA